jgi:hypothetical protein
MRVWGHLFGGFFRQVHPWWLPFLHHHFHHFTVPCVRLCFHF